MKEIVVLSGKGGAGKTSISAALFAMTPRSVAVDADVDAADHSEPPSSVTRIEPSASTRRVLRSPRLWASRMVLWTP